MTPEQEIRELSGECALLLRTLDRVRRVVYDRLDGHPTGRLLLDTVNTAYNETPTQVQHVIDEALVRQAVRRHAEIMLKHMSADRAPKPGDTWPSYHHAQSQWHMARIIALNAVPVAVAAKQLREEALAAITPTTKETPA